jgi:membrane protease YdiL (CAAX protease family)
VQQAFELLVLYVGVPIAIQAGLLPRVPILILLLGAAGCTTALLIDPRFDRTLLFNASGAMAHAANMLAGFAVLGAIVVALVVWLARGDLFDLLRTRPRLWALVMIFYPVASVYPQELIYRAFFFYRYASLFPGRSGVVASAAVFSIGHVFFRRPWVAMSLTFVGGLLFAYHYLESRSLLLASIEHALFGQLVFTVGLGRYFYSRAARA